MKKRYSEIIAKAKNLNKVNQKNRQSHDYIRVIGLLSGLGFLIAPDIQASANSKVDIELVIKIGLNIEPRILEVLPAAILSFPKSFLHHEKMPPDFREVLTALRKGVTGPSFANIEFDKFLEAAKRPLKNKKIKSIEEKRIPKTFRLSPKAIKELHAKAASKNESCTAYLERLIMRG